MRAAQRLARLVAADDTCTPLRHQFHDRGAEAAAGTGHHDSLAFELGFRTHRATPPGIPDNCRQA